jgi:DNA-binding GntR family transcriptional regulator
MQYGHFALGTPRDPSDPSVNEESFGGSPGVPGVALGEASAEGPFEYKSLAVAVSDWVARAIVTGELPAGSRLTEVELAARLSVSRSPVREALQRLSREGLIELTPRRGAQVARLDPDDVRQLYECRILLEPYCSRLAVEAMQPRELEELQVLFELMDPTIRANDHNKFLDLNIQYHRALIRPSPNRVLRELVELTWNRSERYWRLLRVVSGDHMDGSYGYHQALHETVTARNAKDTEEVMRRLLEFALQQILEHFPQRDQQGERALPAQQPVNG